MAAVQTSQVGDLCRELKFWMVTDLFKIDSKCTVLTDAKKQLL